MKDYLRKVFVRQGTVIGCEEFLPNGKKYLRFSGIPYAKPPVHNLRFQPPKKLLKFEKPEIDCTEERDPCFHKSPLTRKYVGSENCLNLNVYVPEQLNSDKFAVLVYIHGGALKYDSNTRQLYSPEHLLMENVIVVTVNYRLHILGFLSLPSKGISGNNGLKDQQMALQWVYENISEFNGDPDNICLFGESAGASCVQFHVLNEKSRQFIKSAICQSGSATMNIAYRDDPTEKDVLKVAKLLGCETESLDDALETLMNANVEDLYENCEKIATNDEIFQRLRRWRIVIEDESENAFVSKLPVDLIASQADKINIPIIFGTNNGDGMPRMVAALKQLDELNADITQALSSRVVNLAEDRKFLAAEIKKFYFGEKEISKETQAELAAFYSDSVYLAHQMLSVDLFSVFQPDCKMFLNEFQFEGDLNIQKKLVKLDTLEGACHADDVFYLFGGVLADNVKINPESREAKMRKTMCSMWANFAKYGNPTPDNDRFLNFKWTPTNSLIDFDVLAINEQPKMVRNLNKDRIDFWRWKFGYCRKA